ncbi:MAG: sugar phosphate isomerase/epimerase [Nitrososphaerota archaeon]|nr:sugar phosphate isomerase/epimerase [Nitrososphaerota archaeon]
MRLGLSTWSLLGLEAGAAVRAIGEAGLDYIELWGEVPHAYPSWAGKEGIRDALSSYDMVVTAHAPFTDLNPATPFQPVKDAIAETLESFVEYCVFLGARVVTVHPGSVHNEALVSLAEDSAASTLRRLVRAAGGRVSINVENQTKSASKYYYPLASTPESLYSILKKVPGAGVTLASGQAHASGEDPAEITWELGGDLTEIHLTDNSGELDDHLIPGRGTAPLGSLLKQVSGRDVLVCLELNPHRYTPEQALGAVPAVRRAYAGDSWDQRR